MTNDRFLDARAAMVSSQLRTNAVIDPALLHSFETVSRELFVPGAFVDVAYVDVAIVIGEGRSMNPPLATARLIGEARLRSTDRVLLIAAATGYAAAVLAPLCAAIVAVEEDANLAATARDCLRDIDNVVVVEALLGAGHIADAPYDVIIIDGAIEILPQTLIDQCVEGGRIVSAIVDNGPNNNVVRLCSGRVTGGFAGLLPFADLAAVRLPGFARVREFSF